MRIQLVRAEHIIEGDIARVADKGTTWAQIVGEYDGNVVRYANPYSGDGGPVGTYAPRGRYDLIEVQYAR